MADSPAALVQPASSPTSLENQLGGADGRRYCTYQFDLATAYVGRSLLEVGSGLGHFSARFSGSLGHLIESDNDPYCISQLRERYRGRDHVEVLELALPGRVKARCKVDKRIVQDAQRRVAEDVDEAGAHGCTCCVDDNCRLMLASK